MTAAPGGILALHAPAPPVGVRRTTAIGAAMALLVLAAVVGIPRLLPVASGAAPGASVPFDVDQVVERASHAIRPTTGGLAVEDPAYLATFDARGFSYTPTGSSASVAVSLAAVERGGRPVPLDPGTWRADTDVASRPVAPGVEEQVTARSGEIEWDLVLASEPAGTGDLVVRAGLSGVDAAAVEGRALRLRLHDGTVARLGETVVVDAAGRELHRSLPVVRDGTVELHVPGTALVGAAYPLEVDPVVTGPRQVDRDLASHNGTDPAVAFDGKDFLVVWVYFGRDDGRSDIFATRVSGDGTSVGGSFALSRFPAIPDRAPDVAWNGSTFLVVWEEVLSSADTDVWARRVSPSGFPVGEAFGVTSPTGHQITPAVTAAGGTFYVVWEDQRTGAGDLLGARVSGAGALLDATPKVVADDARRESAPDVAWNGEDLLVAYQFAFGTSDDDVYAQRVAASGTRTGTRQIISSGGHLEWSPTVASDGDEFLVAWGDRRNGSDWNVFASRTDATGVSRDPDGIPVSTGTADDLQAEVAFNGVYLVAWKRSFDAFNADIRASRIRTNGVVVDPDGIGVDTSNLNYPNSIAVARTAGSERWTVVQERGIGSTDVQLQIYSSK